MQWLVFYNWNLNVVIIVGYQHQIPGTGTGTGIGSNVNDTPVTKSFLLFPTHSCVLAALWLVALVAQQLVSLSDFSVTIQHITADQRQHLWAIRYSSAVLRRGAAAAGYQRVCGGPVEASERGRLWASRGTYRLCRVPLLSLIAWRGCQRHKRRVDRRGNSFARGHLLRTGD